jgi:hypothetical protein
MMRNCIVDIIDTNTVRYLADESLNILKYNKEFGCM